MDAFPVTRGSLLGWKLGRKLDGTRDLHAKQRQNDLVRSL